MSPCIFVYYTQLMKLRLISVQVSQYLNKACTIYNYHTQLLCIQHYSYVHRLTMHCIHVCINRGMYSQFMDIRVVI